MLPEHLGHPDEPVNGFPYGHALCVVCPAFMRAKTRYMTTLFVQYFCFSPRVIFVVFHLKWVENKE